jgi:hypothetical protein
MQIDYKGYLIEINKINKIVVNEYECKAWHINTTHKNQINISDLNYEFRTLSETEDKGIEKLKKMIDQKLQLEEGQKIEN